MEIHWGSFVLGMVWAVVVYLIAYAAGSWL